MSELRHGGAHLLQRVQRSRGPVVVTQRGRAAAVLWTVREYERAQHERQILLALLRGQRDITDGVRHDLDRVLAEADALLNADEP